MDISYAIQCDRGNHSTLSIDDMGEGTLVLTSEQSSVSLSIDQLHAAVLLLSSRYPVAS